MELYHKYRPKTFSEMVGQDEAIRMLHQMGKNGEIPHVLLLTGPSGCGKTTTARILKDKLKCADIDFNEINIAKHNGVDVARNISSTMNNAPVGGPVRIWLFDEFHQATSQFQESMLKPLEDCPRHVYFLLCSTDPQKIKSTIQTRCTQIHFKPVQESILKELLQNVLEKESKKIDNSVLDAIITTAEGSPRKALVLLNQVIYLNSTEEQLASIDNTSGVSTGFKIAQMLFNPKKHTWKDIAAELRTIKDDPEKVRWVVMGYCKSCLLKGDYIADIADKVMSEFMFNFYDTKENGLVYACWRAYNNVKG